MIAQQPMRKRAGQNDGERGLLSRALELAAPDTPERALILARIGGALALGLGNIQEGRASIDASLDIARRIGDQKLEITALVEQSSLELWACEWQSSVDIAKSARALVAAHGDLWTRSRLDFQSCAANSC